jgi:hypothetical protein
VLYQTGNVTSIPTGYNGIAVTGAYTVVDTITGTTSQIKSGAFGLSDVLIVFGNITVSEEFIVKALYTVASGTYKGDIRVTARAELPPIALIARKTVQADGTLTVDNLPSPAALLAPAIISDRIWARTAIAAAAKLSGPVISDGQIRFTAVNQDVLTGITAQSVTSTNSIITGGTILVELGIDFTATEDRDQYANLEIIGDGTISLGGGNSNAGGVATTGAALRANKVTLDTATVDAFRDWRPVIIDEELELGITAQEVEFNGTGNTVVRINGNVGAGSSDVTIKGTGEVSVNTFEPATTHNIVIENTGGVILQNTDVLPVATTLTVRNNGLFIVDDGVFTITGAAGGSAAIDATTGTVVVRNRDASSPTTGFVLSSVTLKKVKLLANTAADIVLTGSTGTVLLNGATNVTGTLDLFGGGSISIAGPIPADGPFVGTVLLDNKLTLNGANANFFVDGPAANKITFVTASDAVNITGDASLTLHIGGSRSATLAIPAGVTATLTTATINVGDNPGKITFVDNTSILTISSTDGILKFGSATINGTQAADYVNTLGMYPLGYKTITTGGIYGDGTKAGTITSATGAKITAGTAGLIIDMLSTHTAD